MTLPADYGAYGSWAETRPAPLSQSPFRDADVDLPLEILEVAERLFVRWSDWQADADVYDAYYHGQQRLAALGMAVPPQMEKLSTVVNWPRLVVDSLDERLDIEGFRYPGEATGDHTLWRWWRANQMDVSAQIAHTEALVFGRSFAVVGTPRFAGDAPVITVESARDMMVDIDPVGRFVRAGLKVWADGKQQRATLWLPGLTVVFAQDVANSWHVADIEQTAHEFVPIVPLFNRPATEADDGESEMGDIMPLTDAVCRTLTTMQAAGELSAVPQRYVFGASPEDFMDSDGRAMPKWEAYMGRIWTMANPDGKAGSFPAADLRNFTEAVNSYAHIVASLSGLPPHYVGFTADNPASADAIRSSEARLVKRAERRQRGFGNSWATVMRMALVLAGESLPSGLDELETVWRDPATPTFASKADAVVKLVQAGIYPKAYGPEALGLSEVQQARIAKLREQEEADNMDRLVAGMQQPGSEAGNAGQEDKQLPEQPTGNQA